MSRILNTQPSDWLLGNNSKTMVKCSFCNFIATAMGPGAEDNETKREMKHLSDIGQLRIEPR